MKDLNTFKLYQGFSRRLTNSSEAKRRRRKQAKKLTLLETV
jgi:hypothetical protein